MDNYENVVHSQRWSQRQTKLILKIEYCIVHNAFEKLKKKMHSSLRMLGSHMSQVSIYDHCLSAVCVFVHW